MKWFVRGFVLIFICFTIWYHIPTKHEREYSISTFQNEGKTGTIKLNVKKYKKFFRPTVIKGELIYNNQTYTSIDFSKSKFSLDRLKQKLQGKLEATMFVHSKYDLSDMRKLMEWEMWYIQYGTDDDLDMLLLSYKEEKVSRSEIYTAPATNNEEATSVFFKLLGRE